MPLSLKEAEAAAYTDPSQENLAVYVKLLEEELEGREDYIDRQNRLTELDTLREELEEALDELNTLREVGT